MAEETGQERTEAPTQRRREEARQQGQFAVSQELTSGAILLAGLVALYWGGRPLADGLLNYLRLTVQGSCHGELTVEQGQLLFRDLFFFIMQLLGWFMAAVVTASLGAGLLQVGLYVNPELITFRWEKLAPAENISRLFSVAALARALLALLKLAAMAGLAYWVLRDRAGQIASLHTIATAAAAAAQGWDTLMRLALVIAAALFLLGAADYAYQRYRFEMSLRMTRQELKEELKREEGDPLIKARIRRLQREAAQRRMLAEVPRATVVITNPTHFAVALRYDRATMPAPRVVAKGAHLLAERIVALARQHGVPLVERRPLARTLYYTVRLDQPIPPALYVVVAEVLVYLYRLRGLVGKQAPS